MRIFLKAGENLVPLDHVTTIDISRIEDGEVKLINTYGAVFTARGFDAVMLLKPSALEGKRMRWQRNAWAFHNLVAHPIVQILAWLGLKKQAVRFHDWTTPVPRGFQGERTYE